MGANVELAGVRSRVPAQADCYKKARRLNERFTFRTPGWRVSKGACVGCQKKSYGIPLYMLASWYGTPVFPRFEQTHPA